MRVRDARSSHLLLPTASKSRLCIFISSQLNQEPISGGMVGRGGDVSGDERRTHTKAAKMCMISLSARGAA